VVNGTTLNPWGDADIDADETSSDPTAPGEPKLLARLSDLPLSRIWAIQDLDLKSPTPRVPRGIAPKPVHGDKRNALFFDFHVESVPLDYKP
jgi:prepilin-type processing-associated H-X9-DG protein